ncbi:hypothetical protein ml_162 [Mollivirus sibericum]|uniref:hypothetical protein n=1 Tax=Mollivirus sibericum TaxID=1678078 RepID=UPI0006B2DCD8|nr:hypothetical protein ml_162 [Mollivirus sibericum]ALD61964.1 hypothetical protein ml_162 [Mollivirus sibericum]
MKRNSSHDSNKEEPNQQQQQHKRPRLSPEEGDEGEDEEAPPPDNLLGWLLAEPTSSIHMLFFLSAPQLVSLASTCKWVRRAALETAAPLITGHHLAASFEELGDRRGPLVVRPVLGRDGNLQHCLEAASQASLSLRELRDANAALWAPRTFRDINQDYERDFTAKLPSTAQALVETLEQILRWGLGPHLRLWMCILGNTRRCLQLVPQPRVMCGDCRYPPADDIFARDPHCHDPVCDGTFPFDRAETKDLLVDAAIRWQTRTVSYINLVRWCAPLPSGVSPSLDSLGSHTRVLVRILQRLADPEFVSRNSPPFVDPSLIEWTRQVADRHLSCDMFWRSGHIWQRLLTGSRDLLRRLSDDRREGSDSQQSLAAQLLALCVRPLNKLPRWETESGDGLWTAIVATKDVWLKARSRRTTGDMDEEPIDCLVSALELCNIKHLMRFACDRMLNGDAQDMDFLSSLAAEVLRRYDASLPEGHREKPWMQDVLLAFPSHLASIRRTRSLLSWT